MSEVDRKFKCFIRNWKTLSKLKNIQNPLKINIIQHPTTGGERVAVRATFISVGEGGPRFIYIRSPTIGLDFKYLSRK